MNFGAVIAIYSEIRKRVSDFATVLFYVKGPLVFYDWYEQARVIDNPAMLSNVQALQSALWWIVEGHLSPKAFQSMMTLIQVILFSLIFILAPKRNRDDWIFTSTLALTVLISPLAWKHSYLNFLPLFYQWFREDPSFRERRTQTLHATALIGLVVLPSLIGAWDREFSNRLYLMPYTGVILIIGGLILARRADQMLPIEK